MPQIVIEHPGSGDTLPYALEREIEDLDALIRAAGGSANLFGASSGGALALEAAAAGLLADRIAVYEVPYFASEPMLPIWRDYVERLETALAAGRRDEALELFMRIAGSPEEQIAQAKASEYWPNLLALAHTLAYDAACLGDGRVPAERLAGIAQPTLVMTGARPGGDDFFDPAADAVVAALPNAERLRLGGAGHMVDPKLAGPALVRFFTG